MTARTSTADPVADLRAAADAIREDYPAVHPGSRFWRLVADILDTAAEQKQYRPHTIVTPGDWSRWNKTVEAARAYLDAPAAWAGGKAGELAAMVKEHRPTLRDREGPAR